MNEKKKIGLNKTIKEKNLHRDTTKDEEFPEKVGFLRAMKEYRHSSTHGFTVLHDEYIGLKEVTSRLVDHEQVSKFEELTLSSIRLVRAALFDFCDAINFTEEQISPPPDAFTVTLSVPSHDYIRGNVRLTE